MLNTSIDDNGNATAITIDSSENVGTAARLSVGTTTVGGGNTKIVATGGTDNYLQLVSNTGSGGISLGNAGANLLIYSHTGALGSESFTERMRITSEGKVGIGKTDPNYPLVVAGTNPKIQIYDSAGSGQTNLYFGDSGSNLAGYVIYQHSDNKMRIGTNASDKFVIDSTGNLFYINAPGSAAGNPSLKINTGTGYIYYDSSSLRYKENVQDFPNALAKVNQLRPVTYDDKATGEASLGLIAEEVNEITPELVTYKEIDGSLQPETVVYDRLTIHLLKAIQEQQEQIESLQQEIEVLKNG